MPTPSDRIGVTDGAEEETVGSPRHRLPSMSVLPTLCTLGNLVAGFTALHFAARPVEYAGPWGWSGLTIAVTFDNGSLLHCSAGRTLRANHVSRLTGVGSLVAAHAS